MGKKSVKEPCAYCGTTRIKRTSGHVLSKHLYPESLSQAERIKVPECLDCKLIWEDAEPHFRNIMLAIWNPDVMPADNRAEKMRRSLEKCDGHRRAMDIFKIMRPTNLNGQCRDMIYPAQDRSFNLILRRIVRGLCYKHKLGAPIADERVCCDVMRWQIPPAFQSDFTWKTIAPDFFRYGYSIVGDELHSFWLLHFSKHLVFCGVVELPTLGATCGVRALATG